MGKDCGNHDDDDGNEKLYRRLFAAMLALVIIVLLVILIVWLVLRPTKPSFVLQDACITQFNTTPPNLLTSSIQVTLASHNPNNRIGIFYDRLEIYAAYMSQQITLRTVVPPTYEGSNDVNVWSPILCGYDVPVAPYLAGALGQAQSFGVATFSVRVDGSLRWKVGSWTSGHYHIHVHCDAYLSFSGHRAVFPISQCFVDV